MIYRFFLAILLTASAWDLSAWQPITQSCSTVQGDTLIMECESAGLASVQRYSGAVRGSVEVQAQAIGTTPNYWAGLALNSDVVGDGRYAEVALTRGIEPFDGGPAAVALSTTSKADCCLTMQTIDPALWHTLSVDYANGRATYTVDGKSTSVRVKLGSSYHVELLCVAVNPGTHIDGALSRCNWRNLSVVGHTAR